MRSCASSVEPPICGVRMTLGRRSEEHTSELQSQSNLVCRLLLEKKKKKKRHRRAKTIIYSRDEAHIFSWIPQLCQWSVGSPRVLSESDARYGIAARMSERLSVIS